MRIVAKTDKGNIRESNQDAFAIGEFPNDVVWAVVCDGMGGAAGGNIASTLAVEVIRERINASYRDEMKDSSIINMLDSAIAAANVEVYDFACSKQELQGMGTTGVCAVLRDGQAFIAHAGDSRAYIFGDGEPRQVTEDHSVVQDLLNNGRITADEAKNHPNRNIITRALGVNSSVDVEFDITPLLPNDILLLCSDGLSNYVSDEEMASVIRSGDYDSCAERLIEIANENGGGDNITVVTIAN